MEVSCLAGAWRRPLRTCSSLCSTGGLLGVRDRRRRVATNFERPIVRVIQDLGLFIMSLVELNETVRLALQVMPIIVNHAYPQHAVSSTGIRHYCFPTSRTL